MAPRQSATARLGWCPFDGTAFLARSARRSTPRPLAVVNRAGFFRALRPKTPQLGHREVIPVCPESDVMLVKEGCNAEYSH
jgi:hypothetical protein